MKSAQLYTPNAWAYVKPVKMIFQVERIDQSIKIYTEEYAC